MRSAVLAIAALLPLPAFAQQGAPPAEKPACPATDAALPKDLADWYGKAALASATGAADIGKSAMALGKAYEANLLDTPKISYPVQPEKAGRVDRSPRAVRVHG